MKLLKNSILSSISLILFILFLYRFIISTTIIDIFIAFVVSVILFTIFIYYTMTLFGSILVISQHAVQETNVQMKVSKLSKEDFDKIFKDFDAGDKEE